MNRVNRSRNTNLHESVLIEVILLLTLSLTTIACEVDTRLVIEQTNTIKFVLSGSGTLGSLRVVGPNRQREAYGEDASVYWMIKPKPEQDPEWIGTLSPVIYGKLPPGYVQVYPEQGEAPPLIENETYFVDVSTNDANGVRRNFTVQHR